MSQFQNYPPVPPPPGAYGAAPSKPTSITVLSILAIVWGGLGMLCGVVGTIGMLAAVAGGRIGSGTGSRQVIVHHDPGQAVTMYQEIAPIIGLAMAVILLAVGIGGLMLRPWARRMAMPWSIIEITWACVAVYFAMNSVDMSAIGAGRQQMNPEAMRIGFISGAVGVGLLSCILPACFLIFWNRPHVKAAFEGQISS